LTIRDYGLISGFAQKKKWRQGYRREAYEKQKGTLGKKTDKVHISKDLREKKGGG